MTDPVDAVEQPERDAPVAHDEQVEQTERAGSGLLARCRTLAKTGAWAEIRALTDDEAAVLAEPRLLGLRLVAAKGLADPALFADVGRMVAALPDESPPELSLLRELALAGQGPIVASILMARPALTGEVRFFKLASIVRRSMPGRENRKLAKQFRTFVNDASGGGMKMRPVRSPYSFARRPEGPHALGTVTLTAASCVQPHHLPGLEEQAGLFRRGIAKSQKRDAQPDIEEYRDVFTDRNGQIWNEAGQIIRSKGRVIAQVTRDAVPNVDVAMMSQSATRGIYHWLVDRVPRFAWLREPANAADDVRILISDVAPKFEMACMEMMGLADRVQPVGDAVFVRRLVIPQVGFHNMVGWRHVDWGIHALVASAMDSARAAGVDLPAKVYISRQDAKRRVLSNEAELEADLARRGFAIFRFSEIPIWHQIALVHSAQIVVAPHGAGLAHLIFSRRGAKVVEILPIKDGSYLLRFNYARLSITKGLDYSAWVEEQAFKINGWTMDREAFLPFLDDILARAGLS